MDGSTTTSSVGAAVLNGDIEALERLLAAGDEPNTEIPRFGSALSIAVWSDCGEAVALLLEHGADPDAPGDQGEGPVPPIVLAAARGNDSVIEALAANGAMLEATDAFGYTALTRAVDLRSPSTVDLLLELGASPGGASPRGPTLMEAAVIAAWPPNLDYFGDRAASPTPGALIAAVREGHVDWVTALLDEGVDPTEPGPMWLTTSGGTALDEAKLSQDPTLQEMLNR